MARSVRPVIAAAVRVHDALGQAGGARAVDDVALAVRVRPRPAGAVVACRAMPGRDLDPVAVAQARRRRACGSCPASCPPRAARRRGAQCSPEAAIAGGAAVAHHRGDGRIAHRRVERHDGHARLAGAEQQQRHLGAVLHQHREPRTRREIQLQQTVRHLVRRSVELGPGPAGAPRRGAPACWPGCGRAGRSGRGRSAAVRRTSPWP